MAKEITSTPKEIEPSPVQETGITKEQLEEVLQQNKQLMETIRNLSAQQQASVPVQPIINDVVEPIEQPRRVKFRISAFEPDDAIVDGMIVPGKKIVGAFKYTSEIKIDGNGAYLTGFELDKLEQESGLSGEELTNYQKDVKIATRYIERMTGQSISSLNKNFWNGKGILVDNLELEYDTSLIDNLIKYYNILGGSFPGIARNREDASINQKLLYLDIADQEIKSRMNTRMTRMDANAVLRDVRDKWKIKDVLLLVYAISTKKNHGYVYDTPKEILIGELDDYIEGVDTQSEKKKRPTMFLEFVDKMNSPTEGQRIRIQGLIKAGEYYGFVAVNKEGAFILKSSGNTLGSSIKSAVEYLINPVNADDFGALMAAVTKKWTD
jgi:hypothetical protein